MISTCIPFVAIRGRGTTWFNVGIKNFEKIKKEKGDILGTEGKILFIMALLQSIHIKSSQIKKILDSIGINETFSTSIKSLVKIDQVRRVRKGLYGIIDPKYRLFLHFYCKSDYPTLYDKIKAEISIIPESKEQDDGKLIKGSGVSTYLSGLEEIAASLYKSFTIKKSFEYSDPSPSYKPQQLFIGSKNGRMDFMHNFGRSTDSLTTTDFLLLPSLTSMRMMGGELFDVEASTIERMRFGNHEIILRSENNYLYTLVYQGDYHQAKDDLLQFIKASSEYIEESDEKLLKPKIGFQMERLADLIFIDLPRDRIISSYVHFNILGRSVTLRKERLLLVKYYAIGGIVSVIASFISIFAS